ncbi:metallophosphoesterase [Luteolibacter yonseiensis]|uniref:Metallophosphoesterase n=1 Tax=Luteolibacter yonseiensis TaxID=1144680 RepID=A0A934R376_9BACT|nr:metallophosphoesterase [Luteolibacter yonseiensis]MBK1814665.1 metallophosphoesterase [Luteolibacter yonseiensis]
MSPDPTISRRRMLKTLFCSSVAMQLNLAPEAAAQARSKIGSLGALDLLAIGDFGTNDDRQKAVARGMARYTEGLGKKPDGLLLLGDNFYGSMKDGLKSERWETGFSDVFPSKTYPGPCWPVLGNHDYHDTPGNELVQLGYAASLKRRTRWTMPGKYYRVDLPAVNPQVTMLMLDTNWQKINSRIHGDRPCWMSPEEKDAQMVWFEKELNSPRAPFTIVVGHHPIYSEGSHGDTSILVKEVGPLLEKHGVHLYIGGHDHDLQHLELEGLKTSFVVSGGGGARLHSHDKIRGGSTVFDAHGFSHITLADNRLQLRHVDSNGKILHAFSKGVKHDWKVEA